MRNPNEEVVSVPAGELANLELLRRQTAGAAHTLNNLFTSLLGELALLDDERRGDGRLEDAIGSLREQLERCVKLVRNGLDRRPLGGDAVGEVDLGLLLSRCRRMLEGTLPRRIRWRIEVPDESWLVRGDAREMELLILALIFRLGDLVPGGCMDIRVSLCPGNAFGKLALRLDVEAAGLPSNARQRLIDPGLSPDATEAASLAALHAIADRHGTHLQTARAGAESLRLSLAFERLDD